MSTNYTHYTKKIRGAGRTVEWITKEIGMNRITFWRKVKSNSLTKEEKTKINNLLK